MKRNDIVIHPIAYIETDFPEKFGVPRQSGLIPSVSRIVMEEEYRVPEAFRGLDGYSHIWLLWQFSENTRDGWSPTVRPPRLGGNVRKGVFATRSPFRPNSIGMSCVKLLSVEMDPALGPVLFVEGADMMNGTPIIDIKPYHPGADSHPEADAGFTSENIDYRVHVNVPEELLEKIPEEKRETLLGALAEDPRPPYQRDPERVYGMSFLDFEVKFRVDGKELYVISVEKSREL